MKYGIICIFGFALIATTAARADSWTSQPLVPPTVSGNYGVSSFFPPNVGTVNAYDAVCSPANFVEVPCGPGTQLEYLPTGPTTSVTAVPSLAIAPGSSVGIQVEGLYQDASSPAGLSRFSGELPLSDFASAADVGALNTSLAQLQSVVAAENINLQNLHAALNHLDQKASGGVAMAFAMPSADVQPGEHFALAGNWGEFDGQHALALAGAVRINDRLSLNAGVARSVNSGMVGVKAGFRFGW